MLNPQFNKQISTPSPPIFWSDKLEAWEVRTYAEVLAILLDNRFAVVGANFKDQNTILPSNIDTNSAYNEVIRAFKQELPWVRKKILKIIRTACQNKRELTTFDFYSELILPSCQQLALELTDSSILPIEWDELLQNAQAVFMMNGSENPDQAHDATTKLSSYFLNKIELARKSPKLDFIGVLAQTEAEPSILVAPIIQLFVGLATSLPLLLSNVLLTLLTNSAEKDSYQLNPPQSINELLRYAGPAQFVYRSPMEEVVWGAHVFKTGDLLALFLANANFDATQFSCPHLLNLNRDAVAHLSLGKGLHSCLGAPLIREAVIIIPRAILNYFPDASVDKDRVVWGGSVTIQGAVCLIKN